MYIRGETYLVAGQDEQPAAELQKILHRNGIVWHCCTGTF
jgi:hypothetical protein